MSDRGYLFFFGVAVILICLGASGWLIATGQALTVDGLFLLLTCLLVALAFALYLKFMIKRALESLQPAKPQPKAATASPQKPAAVGVVERE